MTAGSARSQFRLALQPGLETIRRLWKPFVAIQLLGLVIVFSYFKVDAVTGVFDAIADFKTRVGLIFVLITMPTAGAIIPELFKSITGVERGWNRARVTFLIHNFLLYLVLGLIAEYFYLGLNTWLGDSRAPSIVLAKTGIDQFIYSPLLSLPLIAFTFTWRRAGYRFGIARREIGGAWYLREVVPLMALCWAYWVPMGILMYTLPAKLTFVYGMIGNAASATLFTATANRPEASGTPAN